MFRYWIAITGLLICVSSCGGAGGNDSSADCSNTPVFDTVPNLFSFEEVIDAVPSSLVESNAIIVRGTNVSSSISIKGGSYSVDKGDYTSSIGTVENGQSVKVRGLSSGDEYGRVKVVLSIGGVSGTFSISTKAKGEISQVFINNDFKHIIGGYESFDRRKYITLHADHIDHDWVDGNAQSKYDNNRSSNLIVEFLEGLDVFMGRSTGAITYTLNSLTPEDPSRAGFADPSFLKENGERIREDYTNGIEARIVNGRPFQDRNSDQILGAQLHPFWPDKQLTNRNWSLSDADDVDEPFGTASGEFMGRFVLEHFKRNEQDLLGQALPAFFELLNEPAYPLVDVLGEDPEKIFRFHLNAAREIRSQFANSPYGNFDELNRIKIGGFTSISPQMNRDNFQRWHDRYKKFIDIAGDEMDFISFHLYDWPNSIRNGQRVEINRKGAHLEAILDMLEQYTTLQFGAPKPLIVSEYGSFSHSDRDVPWNVQRDWERINSVNSQMLQFMERPDLFLKTIPFIVLKAEWGRRGENFPYPARLMRQANEPADPNGEWVYTELVKIYQFWSAVRGTRIDTHSNDADLLVDAYVDGNTSYIILNNLVSEKKKVQIENIVSAANGISSLQLDHLYWDNGEVVLSSSKFDEIPETIILDQEATLLLTVLYGQNNEPLETSTERRVVASNMLESIQADQSDIFEINDVNPSMHGEAVLRLGIGRDHGLSLNPILKFNGSDIEIPYNWKGDDQFLDGRGHESFFGVLEIPVPFNLISDSNLVDVTFPDNGGYISSVVLQVFDHSAPLERVVQ